MILRINNLFYDIWFINKAEYRKIIKIEEFSDWTIKHSEIWKFFDVENKIHNSLHPIFILFAKAFLLMNFYNCKQKLIRNPNEMTRVQNTFRLHCILVTGSSNKREITSIPSFLLSLPPKLSSQLISSRQSRGKNTETA